VNDAKRGLEKYFRLYSQNISHSSLDDKTPDEFYYENLPALQKNGVGFIGKAHT